MAKTRQELTKEIELSLGGGMVDVELDPEHYDLAIDEPGRDASEQDIFKSS